MVTTATLRQTQPRVSSIQQRLQKQKVQRQKVQRQREVEQSKASQILKSKEQSSAIDTQIKSLQEKAVHAKSTLAQGMSLAGKPDYHRALSEMKGINYQLAQLKELKEGLSKGGYYPELTNKIAPYVYDDQKEKHHHLFAADDHGLLGIKQ